MFFLNTHIKYIFWWEEMIGNIKIEVILATIIF